MAEQSTSQFPKMGESPLVGSIVNISGQRSPYMQARPRNGPSADGEAENPGRRTGFQIEGNGPQCRPMTTISYPNAPEHAQTGRALRPLPPAVGHSDFWDRRTEASGQVI